VEPQNKASLDLLRDIFLSPPSAFESLVKSPWIGKTELRNLHLILIGMAPISKGLGNLFVLGYQTVLKPAEENHSSLLAGCLSLTLFYLGFLFFLKIADSFRLYYQDRDRLKNWEGPPPHIFSVSFLPFSATSLFWIFPSPVVLTILVVCFFYCLHLGFLALHMLCDWSPKNFLFFLLQFGIFLMIALFFPLLGYNLFRTLAT